MRMPFGRYKGYQIADIPRDYADWFLINVTDCDDIKAEMRRAHSQQGPPKPRKPKKPKPPRPLGYSPSTVKKGGRYPGSPHPIPAGVVLGPADELPPWEEPSQFTGARNSA